MSTSVRIHERFEFLCWPPDRASASVLRTSSITDHLSSYIIFYFSHTQVHIFDKHSNLLPMSQCHLVSPSITRPARLDLASPRFTFTIIQSPLISSTLDFKHFVCDRASTCMLSWGFNGPSIFPQTFSAFYSVICEE